MPFKLNMSLLNLILMISFIVPVNQPLVVSNLLIADSTNHHVVFHPDSCLRTLKLTEMIELYKAEVPLTPVFLAAGLATGARSNGAGAPVLEALVLEHRCQKHWC